MQSIRVLVSLIAVSAMGVALSCSSKMDGNISNGSGGNAAGVGGSTVTGSGGGGMGGMSTAGSGGKTATGSCTTGSLLAGDPLYNDKPDAGRPRPAGQGLLDDPPIRNEAVAVIGSKLFIETEYEIWSADLGVAVPTLARFAGREDATAINAGGACGDATFLVMRDMTATPQGKLAVVDFVGGAIIEITDPAGPNCKADWVAGTHARTDDPGDDFPLAQGDVDGPGATALFGGDKNVTGIGGGGIHKITVDPAGNLYTWDDGTGKFKKIATDAARTVSTIGHGSTDDNVMGLAFLNGKLYATGVDGANDFLKVIDPSAYSAATPDANVHDVFRNAGDQFPELRGTGRQAIPAQVVSDGTALVISGQSGYVWRVAADGTVLATLAGSGAFLDYQNGFNPLVPHPATEWQLVSSLSNADGGPWLALGSGKVYWSGGIGIGKYIMQFACP